VGWAAEPTTLRRTMHDLTRALLIRRPFPAVTSRVTWWRGTGLDGPTMRAAKA